MSRYKALSAYERLLRGLHKSLTIPYGSVEDMLEAGFEYMVSRLHLERIGLFRWDEKTSCMHSTYAFHANMLMEAEDDILVDSGSPLWPLIKDAKPVVMSSKSPWVAYVPLMEHGRCTGAVCLERKRPMPKGSVLSTIPRFQFQASIQKREFPFLEDIGDILSTKLHDVLAAEQQRKEARYFQAAVEVAQGVVEAPRLADMLSSVSESLIQNMGVDRVRFYLIDSSKQELHGVLGLQIPNRLLSLEKERYALIPHSNVLVDAVLGAHKEGVLLLSDSKVLLIPLQVGGHMVGCMAIDNLLSQQSIDTEQIRTIKVLSVQIAMAVQNAQLFEDIEQQAVTDGLTKLYVYRYFQQRLKEEIDRADRYSYSVALVMMDVDNFKEINDTYGHPFGDKVLETLAQHIRANIRRIDLAARYGGDEFVLLLPEITEREAWLMGARLLNSIKQNVLQTAGGEHVPVAVSLGVAMYPSDAKTARELIESSDRALYWSKKNNRGDISFYRTLQAQGHLEKMA
jgi:diguanylate cyclase (GGDEF)-like protein